MNGENLQHMEEVLGGEQLFIQEVRHKQAPHILGSLFRFLWAQSWEEEILILALRKEHGLK